MSKVKFVCARPGCEVGSERYPSQIRNPDRLYCSTVCKKLDESRWQQGELNSNFRTGKHLDTVCSCGNVKDYRSKTCLSCKDTSYNLDNLQSSSDPLKIFTLGTVRRNFVVIRKMMQLGLVPTSCQICNGPNEWQGKPLTLQLDHINGNPADNRLENLRFLCPNCHSQTETWGYRGREKRPD